MPAGWRPTMRKAPSATSPASSIMRGPAARRYTGVGGTLRFLRRVDPRPKRPLPRRATGEDRGSLHPLRRSLHAASRVAEDADDKGKRRLAVEAFPDSTARAFARLALGFAALVLVLWHRLQRILGPVGGQYQRLAVTRAPDIAPPHSDVLRAHAEKAADRDHYRPDGASIVDIDVLDLADGLIVLVADVRADEGISRDLAVGIEVAGRGRRSRVAVR